MGDGMGVDGEERPGVDTARVAAAFRAAAGEAPPAGFDVGDVVAASRRIARRRRSALAGGALAVLVVAGVGVAAVTGSGRPADTTVASAASADAGATSDDAARAAAPRDAPAGGAFANGPVTDRLAPPPPQAATPDAAASGAAGAAAGAPLGPGTAACAERQDPALRALVEQVLPEAVGAQAAVTTQECRPGGERGVALQVRDGVTAGVLAVTYLPPGEAVDPPGIAEAPAAVVRTAPTASGGTVVVSSRVARAGDPAPFAGRLDAAVAALAPRL